MSDIEKGMAALAADGGLDLQTAWLPVSISLYVYLCISICLHVSLYLYICIPEPNSHISNLKTVTLPPQAEYEAVMSDLEKGMAALAEDGGLDLQMARCLAMESALLHGT